MKIRVIIAVITIFALIECYAQIKKPSDAIPKGYELYETYFGDLNNDGHDDSVLIIKNTDTSKIVSNRFDKIVDRNRRGIIVLLKSDKGYTIVDKNYDCFSSENEDGGVYYPPELNIDFQKGNLIVQYSHGRYGYWSYTFRRRDAHFELIGFDISNNRSAIVNSEMSINFLTKKKLFKENTNENAEGGDEVFKETWSTIKIDKLLKLAEIVDFDELNLHH